MGPRYGERDLDLDFDLSQRNDLEREAGDLGAEILVLVLRSTLMPLTEVCDVVAFVSEPDSMISPSEGVDGDLDRRDAITAMFLSYLFYKKRKEKNSIFTDWWVFSFPVIISTKRWGISLEVVISSVSKGSVLELLNNGFG